MGFRLLKRNRNFRQLFIGQSISAFGTTLYTYFAGFFLLDHSGSIFLFGAYVASVNVLEILLKYLASVWVEKLDKKNMVVLSDALHGGIMLLALGLVTGGLPPLWVVVILSFASSAINVVFTPAINSLYPLVLSREEMKGAISFRTSLYRLLQIFSIAAAGIIYEVISLKAVLLVNGLSFIISALMERTIEMAEETRPQRKKEPFSSMAREGWSYIKRTPGMLHYCVLSAFLNLYAAGYASVFQRSLSIPSFLSSFPSP